MIQKIIRTESTILYMLQVYIHTLRFEMCLNTKGLLMDLFILSFMAPMNVWYTSTHTDSHPNMYTYTHTTHSHTLSC